MERKPIMMPPSLIRHGEALATAAGVSFGEIVRRALKAYDPETSDEKQATLEALAETLIESTNGTIAYLDRVERQLDETHAELENHKYGPERQNN